MLKYKKVSKYEQLLFLRKDGEYMLKNNRPIKDNLIKTINQDKVNTFIEDILVNKNISHLLFRSNSKFEINSYLNTKKKFFTHKSPLKSKNRDNITLRQIKKQTCIEMKSKLKTFKENLQKKKKSMDNINKKRVKLFKKELTLVENKDKEEVKNNKINGYIRAYNSIKIKFDIDKNIKNFNRNNSCILYNNYNKSKKNLLKNKKKKNNNSLFIKSKSSDTYESDIKTNNNFSKIENKTTKNANSLLPHVLLDNNNVFSRLYHNAVLLSPSSSAKNQRKPQTCKNKNNYFTNSQTYNPKIIFKLKKVIKSTSGKEFTFKITKDIIRRCFMKYSGGPQVLDFGFFKKEKNKENYNYSNYNNKIKINESLENDEDDENSKNNDNINYYKLIDKKNGNSFLHFAVIGGYDEFVRYFLEKKSNINLKNFDGNTPLHLALYNKKKNKNIIDILMEYNPRLDIKNNKDEIPFDLFTDEMKIKYGIDKLIIGKGN